MILVFSICEHVNFSIYTLFVNFYHFSLLEVTTKLKDGSFVF